MVLEKIDINRDINNVDNEETVEQRMKRCMEWQNKKGYKYLYVLYDFEQCTLEQLQSDDQNSHNKEDDQSISEEEC